MKKKRVISTLKRIKCDFLYCGYNSIFLLNSSRKRWKWCSTLTIYFYRGYRLCTYYPESNHLIITLVFVPISHQNIISNNKQKRDRARDVAATLIKRWLDVQNPQTNKQTNQTCSFTRGMIVCVPRFIFRAVVFLSLSCLFVLPRPPFKVRFYSIYHIMWKVILTFDICIIRKYFLRENRRITGFTRHDLHVTCIVIYNRM